MSQLLQLHSYQQKIVNEIIKRPKVALWLDIGLGKTICTLTALYKLKQQNMMHRALIIAPKTVVENVWLQELQKWNIKLNLQLVIGNADERAIVLQSDADVIVISRDNLGWLFTQQFDADVLVVDESTSLKDRSTQRWAAICQKTCTIAGKKHHRKIPIIDQFNRVVLLSGTPASESYQGLWAQIYLLDKGQRLGSTLGEFRQRYMLYTLYNGFPVYNKLKKGAVAEINKAIKDICIGVEGHIKLPERVDTVRLTGMADYRYWIMQSDGVINVDKKDIIAGNSLAKYNKLQQISSGFIYDDMENAHELNSAKYNTFKELIESIDENVLVFYRFNYERDKLMQLGGVPLESNDAISKWCKGKIRIALAHPASTGWGLNLASGGAVIIWYTLPLSLEQYIQACGRLHRQGQTKTVRIIHLLSAKTVDEKIYKLLQNKRDVLQGLMEFFKSK